jgi:uncharacterized RDD family membrane protein YckC
MENKDTIFSDINPDETEAGAVQGILTRLIDSVIDFLILFLLYKFVPRDLFLSITNGSPFLIFIFVIAVFLLSRLLLLMIFGKTIGMMICRIKLLNEQLQPLSTGERLLSLFRTRFSKIRYYKEK